jgi:phospho-N-acetylmuramoyl-pentapeptide-transferase
MLYHLLPQFSDVHIVFNVFVYITFRAAGALVTALLLSFLLGPMTIRWLTSLRVGQVIRRHGPETHLSKAGTPTMGGALVVMSATLSTLLWAELTNWYTLLAVASLLWMGVLGFLDDYLKVVRGRTEGLVGRYKMVGQLSFGLILGAFLVVKPISPVPATWTSVPFFADWVAAFWPPAYVAFVALVVSGTSNAVNLTDGLDGLAAGLSAVSIAFFGVFAYLAGRFDWSSYLGLIHLPGVGELTIFALALTGAAIGFLWFNAHPAEVFMGDTGSLALGGALGVMAILLKAEFLLVIVGGVFVMEALSVILQTSWFKYTARRFGEGRRIFRMAPIHHHFEKLGWAESKVVVRFWILGILFAMIGFSTLKIR